MFAAAFGGCPGYLRSGAVPSLEVCTATAAKNIIINAPPNDVTDGSAVTKEKCPNKLESIDPAQDRILTFSGEF